MTIINAIYQYKPNGSWQKRAGIKHIVVHHSAYPQNDQSNEARLRTMMGWHVNNGWPGLSYHYAIMGDGSIYQLNNDNDLTWTDSHNITSLSILVDGYFHPPKNEQPSKAQLDSLHWLAHTLQKKHSVKGDWFIAHRDIARIYKVAPTACCGDILYSQLNAIKLRPLTQTSNTSTISTSELTMTQKKQLANFYKAKDDALTDPRFKALFPDERNALGSYDGDDNDASDLGFLISRILAQRGKIEELESSINAKERSDESLNTAIEQSNLLLVDEVERLQEALEARNEMVFPPLDDDQPTTSTDKKFYESKKFIALATGAIAIIAAQLSPELRAVTNELTVLLVTYLAGQSSIDVFSASND